MTSRLLLVALVAMVGTACDAPSTVAPDMQAPQPTVGPLALFDLTALTAPTTVDFYALPYPNDLRLDSDGTPALAGYHRSQDLVGTFIDTIDAHARGFGNTQAVFFRFDAALDPSTLPDPMASLQPSASVFLVDITPGSTHRGERIPVRLQFNAKHLDFIGDDWLVVQPIPGVPPRSKATYAAIVTDGVKGTSGLAARIAEPLARVLANTPMGEAEMRAATVYSPLRAWLAEHAELSGHVTHASVYTTSDVTALMTSSARRSTRPRRRCWRISSAPETSLRTTSTRVPTTRRTSRKVLRHTRRAAVRSTSAATASPHPIIPSTCAWR